MGTLSDDGPADRGWAHDGAVVRNPSQTQTPFSALVCLLPTGADIVREKCHLLEPFHSAWAGRMEGADLLAGLRRWGNAAATVSQRNESPRTDVGCPDRPGAEMRRRTKMTWWATKRHSPRILAMLTTRVDERRRPNSRQRPSTSGRSAALLDEEPYRSDLKPARRSSDKSCGCSHAAKCPPLLCFLKYISFG
jgi:hypothetical protein